jgi:hypothetical protein
MDCDQQDYGRTRENRASPEPTGNGWMMQETPKTYNMPAYSKKDLRGDSRLDGNAVDDIRKTEIFN